MPSQVVLSHSGQTPAASDSVQKSTFGKSILPVQKFVLTILTFGRATGLTACVNLSTVDGRAQNISCMYRCFCPPKDGSAAQEERHLPCSVLFGFFHPQAISRVPGEGARRLLCGTMNTRSGPGRPWSFQGSGRKEDQSVVAERAAVWHSGVVDHAPTFSGDFFPTGPVVVSSSARPARRGCRARCDGSGLQASPGLAPDRMVDPGG